MSFVGVILTFFFIPRAQEIQNPKLDGRPSMESKADFFRILNPMHVIRQLKHPRILLSVSQSQRSQRAITDICVRTLRVV